MSSHTLSQIAHDLRYAGGAGAAHLAQGAEAIGRQHLQVGIALSRPGPGLSQLLARSGQAHAQVEAPHALAPALDAMDEALVDGGLNLALRGAQ